MQRLELFLWWLSQQYLGGISIAKIKIILCLLLSYPLGHAFRRVPASRPTLRHLYSIAIAYMYIVVIGNTPEGMVHLLATCLISYAIMTLIKGKLMPALVFAFTMCHLAYSHINRQLHKSDSMYRDITAPQMIMVIKLTSTAFCIYDGTRDKQLLTPYQKQHALKTTPSLLELLGYCFFFPSLIVGPAFEISAYRKLISIQDAKVMTSENRLAYRCLLNSMFWIAYYLLASPIFDYEFIVTPTYSSWWLPTKFVYLFLAGLTMRSSYYIAWSMSEGCCRLAGLGFSGFDDNMKPVWQDISNIKVKKIEFSSSQKVMIDNWNIGTNVWLRNHIYVRLLPTTGKSSSRATLITFIVSAFWHGFYPGYYMAFVLTSFGTSAARLLRRNLRPVVLAAAKRSVANDKDTDVESTPIKRIYNVLGWFAGMVIFNVCGCTFVLLDASRSLQAWRALYFTPMIGIAAVILAFQTFKLGRFLPKDSGGAVPAVTIKARSDSGNPAGSSK